MSKFHRITGDAPMLSDAVMDDEYIFLAGKCCTDVPGGEAALGDIRAETEAAMDALGAVLAQLGHDFSDIVTARVFLTQGEDFGGMNEVYTRYFKPGAMPARTCVGVTWMVGGCRVEIDGVARRRNPKPRPALPDQDAQRH
jgi:2-iminobutanoate/2-iminopropanoate deaminase